MTVKARFVVDTVTTHRFGGRQIVMTPVYSSDKASPNYSFSEATPSGKIEMMITNPAAWPLFEPGASLDITFDVTPSSP